MGDDEDLFTGIAGFEIVEEIADAALDVVIVLAMIGCLDKTVLERSSEKLIRADRLAVKIAGVEVADAAVVDDRDLGNAEYLSSRFQ